MDPVAEAARHLRISEYIVVFTGSGISVESGIPTFRGRDGLWSRVDPSQVATPEAYRRNPEYVWEWYRMRISHVLKAKPNMGHKIISKWERVGIVRTVITQNVDNLHYKAGSRNIIELHGNILRVRCFQCGYRDDIRGYIKDTLPRCPKCSGLMRPDVVWFGEPLDPDILARAFREAENSDLMLVIGTSGTVYPAAYIPIRAKSMGSIIVEINPEDTELTSIADICIRMPASRALKALDDEINR